MKNKKDIKIVWLVIKIIVMLALWGGGYYLVSNNLILSPKTIKQWPTTSIMYVGRQGFKSCWSNRVGGSSCTDSSVSTYTYMVDGQQYMSSTSSLIGDYKNIKVYYNPKKPAKSFVEDDIYNRYETSRLAPLIMGVWAIVLGCLLLYFSIRKYLGVQKVEE